MQLPVPTLVPEKSTGNVSMGAGALVADWQRSPWGTSADLGVLDGTQVARLGDAGLLAWLCEERPDAIGFTTTVWNVERTLGLCRKIRQALPGTRIWLGGPEVAADAWFVADGAVERSWFDVAVEGEGEGHLAGLVRELSETSVQGPSIRALGARGAGPETSLLVNPFESKVLAPDGDATVWVEFSRGCNSGCSFCRYHGGRGKRVVRSSHESVRDFFRWARRAEVSQIYVLDPSLDAFPDLREFLRLIASENPPPRIPLFVEMRAEAVDEEVGRALFKAGVVRVECGLQTLTPLAMKRMGRHVDWERFSAGARQIAQSGIDVRVDLMLGLPGDAPESMLETMGKLAAAELAGCTQPFRTQVLPGTPLRRRADQWGVDYEPRPPYRIRRTPTWEASHLAQSLAWAGEHLGVNVTPDDEPVIEVPAWAVPGVAADRMQRDGGGYQSVVYGDSARGAVGQYSWNLFTEAGRNAARNETFGLVGTPCTLWFTLGEGELPLALRLVRDLCEREPHVPLAIVLDAPVGSLAQICGAMSEVANAHETYLERVYGGCGSQSARTIRLHPMLQAREIHELAPGLLTRLRGYGRVMWRLEVPRWEDVVSGVGRLLLPPSDLVLLATAEAGGVPAGLFQRVFEESYFSDQVIWERFDRQWRWTAFLARVRGDSVA